MPDTPQCELLSMMDSLHTLETGPNWTEGSGPDPSIGIDLGKTTFWLFANTIITLVRFLGGGPSHYRPLVLRGLPCLVPLTHARQVRMITGTISVA